VASRSVAIAEGAADPLAVAREQLSASTQAARTTKGFCRMPHRYQRDNRWEQAVLGRSSWWLLAPLQLAVASWYSGRQQAGGNNGASFAAPALP